MNIIDLRKMDLNLLVVFYALMEEGNVTRAAVKLGLTQSAVSAALSRLRALFDDPLFERSRSGMIPTWRALEISSKISPALSSITTVVMEEPEFNPATSTKNFHIAMSDDIELVLAPWLANQKTMHGWTVEFSIHQTNSALWEESLSDDRTDLVLTVTPSQIPAHFDSTSLFTGDYLCLYNPRLLQLSEPVTYEEYVAHDHIRVSYDAQRGWVDALLNAQGHKRKSVSSSSHFSGAATLLLQVPAIATFPEHAAKALASAAGLAVSPVPLQSPNFAISAIWKSASGGSPEHVWLRSIVNEFVQTVK